jgi:hypothetical protein
MSDEPTVPSILDAMRSAADEMRRQHAIGPPRGWYVHLPSWMVAKSDGWDAFCEEFEASYERRYEMAAVGVIGFEISMDGWDRPPRRYTVRRHRDKETPE